MSRANKSRSANTDATTDADSKICPACGLPFANRKKWASRGLWPSIVYCSERCRRAGRARS